MDALYRIYYESNIALSRSVVFYSALAAEVANKQEIENGYDPSHDRKDWRYFKHLNGDYHWMDPEIIITSMDTYAEIPYTKESLSKHKKTLQLYRDEPRHVRELIEKYPNQSMLIRGVINPVPYSISLKAREGEVLWLNDRLIEPQEHDLRYDISAFISKFIHRNFRDAYTKSDDLFLQVQIGQMRMFLAKHIMSKRFERFKTAQAHSYHVTNYLASHNRLDRYVPYMTLEQKLFFYININWIERHIGFTETFDWLVEKLLTLRSLPAYEYRLVQKDPDIDKDEYSPNGVFSRLPINFYQDGLAYTVDEYPIASVLRREVPCATDNLDNLDQYTTEAIELTNESQISSLPTKIIECAVIDPESVAVIREMDVVINHWLYLSTSGHYIGTGELLNPVNGQTMRLTAHEMFLLYWYAMNTFVYGKELDKIDQVGAQRINRHRHVTTDEYKQVLPWKTCPYWQSEIALYHGSEVVLEEAIPNKDEFSDYCQQVTLSMDYRNQWCNGEHYQPHREMRLMLWRMSYVNMLCTLSKPEYSTYAEFFDRIDLQWELISPDTWMDLAVSAFEAATSWSNKNTFSLEEIQRQMIDCFKRLSSYSIQFIDDLIGDMSIVGDNINLIAGPIESWFHTEIDANIPQFDLIDFDKRTMEYVEGYIDVGALGVYSDFRAVAHCGVDISCEVNTDRIGVIDAIMPTIAVAAELKVEVPKERTLDDYIPDDELDGFILSLDPVELSKHIRIDQLWGHFKRLEPVSQMYVVTTPISPSRKVITDLKDLIFRS